MTELRVPTIDFSPLGKLGEIYQNARTKQTLADLGKGIGDGSVNYRQAAGIAGQAGDMDMAIKFLALSEAERKRLGEESAGTAFDTSLANIYRGNAPRQPGTGVDLRTDPATTVFPSSGTKPQPSGPQPQRAPVPSTARTWGDAEAEDAGLYEPRTPRAPTLASLGQAPTPASTPMDRISGGFAAAYGGDAPDTGGTATAVPPRSQLTARAEPSAAPAPSPAAPAQSSAGGGFQLSPRAAELIQHVGNPRLNPERRETAKLLLTRELDDMKVPEPVKLYTVAKAEGFTGSFMDYQLAIRGAGASKMTVDQRGETEEAKAIGKASGERAAQTVAAVGAASSGLQRLNRIESLLGQVEQGKLAPTRMTVSAWARAFGMNDDVAKGLGLDPAGVGSAQALQALISESVLGKIGAGGMPANNFSNADREFLERIFPMLANDPRANKILVETARRVYQSDIDRGKAWSKYRLSNKGASFENFEIEWAEANAAKDRFGDLRREAEQIMGPPRDVPGTINDPRAQPQQRGQLRTFNSSADVASAGLRSGERFLDSQGRERVVP